MTEEACLDCALAGDNVCGYGYQTLKRLHEFESRPEVHVTDLTGCLRKAYLGKTIESAPYPHEKLAMMIGLAVHEYLEVTDEHVESEIALEFDGIHGRADAVFEGGLLLDIKTTRWLNTSRVPYGEHELQVNIYAYMLRKQGHEVNQLQIQYVDMSGPTKCRTHKQAYVPLDDEGNIGCPVDGQSYDNSHLGAYIADVRMWSDKEVEDAIMDRAAELKMSIATGVTPQAETGWLCSYCSFTDVCPEGAAHIS